MTQGSEPDAVRATPRSVVHIRLGSFGLVFAIAIGALGFIAGLPWLTAAMAVLALVVIVDMVIAVRRQPGRERKGDGSAGLE